MPQISVPKAVWCKIRYFQKMYDVDNETLAKQLLVKTRTLYDYDKDAGNIKLNQLENYLAKNNITLEEFLR